MTEQEWLECRSLKFMDGNVPEGTPRKLYLFFLAARGVLLAGELCPACSERHADPQEDLATLFHSRPACPSCCEYGSFYDYVWQYWEGNIVQFEFWNKLYGVVCQILEKDAQKYMCADISDRRRVIRTVKAQQDRHWVDALALFKEIMGNPFRQPTVQREWLTWNDAVVPKLARAIYEHRQFEHCTILADALEDAGCTNTDILDHLRSPGPHVRGCWPVDLLLGKS